MLLIQFWPPTFHVAPSPPEGISEYWTKSKFWEWSGVTLPNKIKEGREGGGGKNKERKGRGGGWKEEEEEKKEMEVKGQEEERKNEGWGEGQWGGKGRAIWLLHLKWYFRSWEIMQKVWCLPCTWLTWIKNSALHSIPQVPPKVIPRCRVRSPEYCQICGEGGMWEGRRESTLQISVFMEYKVLWIRPPNLSLAFEHLTRPLRLCMLWHLHVHARQWCRGG